MNLIKNKSKVLLSLFLIVTMLATIISGCAPDTKTSKESSNEANEPKTKIITDSAGRKVEIPKDIEKVVTVGPVGVLNCFVFAMGEGDKIANGLPPKFAKGDRWKYHKVFNPKIADNTVVEDGEGTIMIEKLIEVNPDLVFTMDEKTAEDIEDKGMKAIVLDWKDPEDVKEAVNLLGEIFNKPERAKEYSKYFDETLEKVNNIVSKIPQEKRVTALNTTLERLSLGHLVGEWWIEAAGGVSVSKDDRKTESSDYSMEELFNWNPDVLLVQTEKDKEFAYSDERFKDLKAVKDKKVYVTPVMGHVWANRTMEQPLTVLWAAKLFYPEEMKDIDINEELKTFSKKFFGYELSDEECKDILGDMK
ncbi:ABC transporter substrate-binding protein [Gottschalkia acidurici]|nr:ABC transporter substrate-binding protein [Gottschalkia acidurici]